MKIGVLAVQGAFAEHIAALERLGAETFEIRNATDLGREMQGLVLPGGESTAMGIVLRSRGMLEPLRQKIDAGLPVFGTCAGLILLAKEIVGQDTTHFATMNIAVRRNAYGRQLGSFDTVQEMTGVGEVPMVFIRAPYIERVWGDCESIAEVDGNIVAARQGKQLVTAFHPELTGDDTVHRYFLEQMVTR